jgi:ATP-dependent RNA helicase DeaD
VEFNRFLDYYKNSKDLSKPKDSKNSGDSKTPMSGFARLFINLGNTDDLKPADLIGLINDITGVRDIKIGEIEILKNFSFFEIDEKFMGTLLKSFKDKEFKKRKIVLEIASKKGSENKRKESKQFGRKRTDTKNKNRRSHRPNKKRRRR